MCFVGAGLLFTAYEFFIRCKEDVTYLAVDSTLHGTYTVAPCMEMVGSDKTRKFPKDLIQAAAVFGARTRYLLDADKTLACIKHSRRGKVSNTLICPEIPEPWVQFAVVNQYNAGKLRQCPILEQLA